jgi:hypothetical protein
MLIAGDAGAALRDSSGIQKPEFAKPVFVTAPSEKILRVKPQLAPNFFRKSTTDTPQFVTMTHPQNRYEPLHVEEVYHRQSVVELQPFPRARVEPIRPKTSLYGDHTKSYISGSEHFSPDHWNGLYLRTQH